MPTQSAAPSSRRLQIFSNVVSHVAFSPCLGLFAIVLDSRTVLIQRTSFARLGTLSPFSEPSSRITCLTWSPDGVHLVLGIERQIEGNQAPSGVLYRHAAEGGQTTRSTRNSDVAINAVPTALHWARGVCSQAARTRYSEKAESIADDAGHILAVGDADGNVTLYSHGISMRIASWNVSPSSSVLSVHLVYGLRACVAVLANGENSLTTVRDVDLSDIGDASAEIHRVGKEVCNLENTSSSLESLIKEIEESWTTKAMEPLVKSVEEPLRKVMSNFGEDLEEHGPWEQLCDVYCGLRVDGAMLQFLAAELGGSGAKEALRYFKSVAASIDESFHGLILHLKLALVAAMNFRGIGRLEGRFEKIGVSVSLASNIFECISQMMNETFALILEFNTICDETEAFLTWLMYVAQRANGESESITNRKRLKDEHHRLLAEFFERKLATSRASAPDIVLTRLENEIRSRLAALSAAHESLGRATNSALSTKLESGKGVNLPASISAEFASRATLVERRQTNGSFIVDMCFPTSKGRLLVLRYSTDDRTWHACGFEYMNSDEKPLSWGVSRKSALVFLTRVPKNESESEHAKTKSNFKLRICKTETIENAGFVKFGGDETSQKAVVKGTRRFSSSDAAEIDNVMISEAAEETTPFLTVRGSKAAIRVGQSHILVTSIAE